MVNDGGYKRFYADDPGGIPAGWDALFEGNGLFNSRVFLTHLFNTYPVPQAYYYGSFRSGVATAASFYRTKLPFRLFNLTFGAPVSVCGIPMVYGSQAGFAPESRPEEVARQFDKIWKGFQMIVGLKGKGPEVPGWNWKRYLITVTFYNKWASFPHYLDAMRSDYRKQVKTSLKKWGKVETKVQDARQFTKHDYELFVALHRSADDKTNPLPLEFFQKLPVPHSFIKGFYRGRLLGWALVLPEGRELHLLYMGYDLASNLEYDIYANLLIEAIKYSIDNNYLSLKMGQTAELIKMRLGGSPQERYILIRHTNPVMNEIIKRTDIFNFRRHYPPLRVFKTQ
jgi:hypothetical protein